MVLDLDPDENFHTVLVRCYDTAGNYSENIVKFPPIISFIAPISISSGTITNAQFSVYSPLNNPITNIALSTSA